MSANFLSYFLDQAGRHLLSQELIIVYVVMFTVRGSFKKIEHGLADITKTVRELNTALLNVETRHANRLDGIEQRVSRLEDSKSKAITNNQSGGSGDDSARD
jgi:Sec-independent protein translocase protein TatA